MILFATLHLLEFANSILQTDDEINAWIYESNRGRSVREVLDESAQVFRQLLAALEGLPNDIRVETIQRPHRAYYLVWVDDQRFPAGEFFDHFHDDHEPDLRAWLARLEQPSTSADEKWT